MSRKRVGKQKVLILPSDSSELVEMWIGRQSKVMCRENIKHLFPGMLPKHGTSEKVSVELTARKV